MTEEQIKVGIARYVCSRFMDARKTTLRRKILVEFEDLDVLNEMEVRNLVRAKEQHENYLPTVGSFAILGDGDDLYQFARTAFERTIRALWELYRSDGCEVDHEVVEFAIFADSLYPDPAPDGLIELGLYLVMEFGVIQAMKMSGDQIIAERFRVAERVIKMRDPLPWWTQRVAASREPLRRFGAPIENYLAPLDIESGGEKVTTELFDDSSFWSLINPELEAEARPRFEAGHYADAVESALKVVAEKVRGRTGLTIDGSDLMHKAFSPKGARLVFDDPIPATQVSMQQGYMELFAGAMTGIRNPKAHGMVQLDRRRCIHFLFLASLLADKVDEAVDAP
jgi:uncharacterized protein (TIGR02391 family)